MIKLNKNVSKRYSVKNVSVGEVENFVTLIFKCRVLQNFKAKSKGAKKGYELLKKKSDALKKAFNDIMKAIVTTKVGMGNEFQ